MSRNKQEIEEGVSTVNLSTIHDLHRFCNEMISNGKGDFRFVVDFNWKYGVLNTMKIKEDSRAIILK